MDIIEHNNRFRYIDVTDDLIPINDIKRTLYDFNVPTVVPTNWSYYNEINQESYNLEFKRKNMIMYKILNNTDNIVVAGGAAAKPLYVHDKNIITDIDIFIYGILDNQLFWNKVNEVAEKIIKETIQLDDTCSITQKIKKGILIIGIYTNYTLIEYQIILRMYHTMSSIIHAFDIPSCCIAYNGLTCYTTKLGAYAHSNQINLISTLYRSTTYEQRLVKYFKRGFGIGFIGYDIKKGYDPITNKLLHKYLNITVTTIDGNHVVGSIETYGYYERGGDYSKIKNNVNNYEDFIKYIQCIEECGLVLQKSNKIINYSLFTTLTANDIIELFPNNIELIHRQCKNIKTTELQHLKYINYSKIVIDQILNIILNSNNIDDSLYKLIKDQIKFNADYIPNWIITQDPQRQYTASINPIIEDPEHWYGNELYIKNNKK